MPALKRNPAPFRPVTEPFAYPTGMVWCPMKMSGMAIMKCARLQRELGCGSRRELKALKASAPERVAFYWPWLRSLGECPERATAREVRELLLAITPLKLAQRSRKNPRAYVCPACGGAKTFGARRCRSC
ncbi:MAG TPA: hypothetical protein VNO43_15985 [Candidatus Eisenbacteria bacterium]|nr:hypothetical protein [Candidatus Eisenbacteria bacterium]